MNAMIQPRGASLAEQVEADFIANGAHLFDQRLEAGACERLLADIRATRRFDDSLFLSEAEFKATYGGVGAPAYERMKADIERRVASRPLLR